ARLILGEPFGRRESSRDLLVAVELLHVLRRRDDRHELRPTLGRLADLDQLHAIGLLRQLAPVLLELVVVGEPVVVADVVAELFLGTRDVALALRDRREEEERQSSSSPVARTALEHRETSRWACAPGRCPRAW